MLEGSRLTVMASETLPPCATDSVCFISGGDPCRFFLQSLSVVKAMAELKKPEKPKPVIIMLLSIAGRDAISLQIFQPLS